MKKVKVLVALMLCIMVAASSISAFAVTLYAEDGRTKDCAQSEVEANLKVGWYKEPVQRLYAADGRSKVYPKKDVEAQLKVGWSTEPFVTMYASDGRQKKVKKSEVSANQKVGWYSYPVTKVYSKDGRTKTIAKSEVAAYKKVGWYETKAEAQASGKSTKKTATSNNPEPDGRYYRTPYGEKYHLDPNCGGKNSYRIAKPGGLAPCSKCVK